MGLLDITGNMPRRGNGRDAGRQKTRDVGRDPGSRRGQGGRGHSRSRLTGGAHEDPQIPNYGRPAWPRLQPGMTFAIEPMITLGDYDIRISEWDGWSIYTADDRSRHTSSTR